MNRFECNDDIGQLICNDCDRVVEAPISPECAEGKSDEVCPYCVEDLELFINFYAW